MGASAPAGYPKQDLYLLGRESFPFEEFGVEVGVVPAKMVATRGEDAALGVALKEASHGDVQCLAAHVLANPNKLVLCYFFLYFLHLPLQFTLLDSSSSHSAGQLLEVKVGHISLVPLEVRIVSKELIELVAS